MSASTKYDPPSGSTVLVTPNSSAMTCCVLSAILTALSEGSASASSIELVCSDCVPPSTPARACMVVLTMLISGCCAVSEHARGLRVEPEPQRSVVLRPEALL